MKRLIPFAILFFLSQSSFATIHAIITDGVDTVGNCIDDEMCLTLGVLGTTTTLPTMVVMDNEKISSDDSMVILSDEVTGEIESREMINKMAAHFETTADVIINTASALLETKEGLSFEGLKAELQ